MRWHREHGTNRSPHHLLRNAPKHDMLETSSPMRRSYQKVDFLCLDEFATRIYHLANLHHSRKFYPTEIRTANKLSHPFLRICPARPFVRGEIIKSITIGANRDPEINYVKENNAGREFLRELNRVGKSSQ